MASKTITFGYSNSSGSYVRGKIELTSTPNTAANNSDVTAKIYVHKGDHSSALTIPTEGSWHYSLTVNGSTKSGYTHASVLESWVLLYTGSWNDIAHGSDGTKSISVSGSVSGPSETSYAGKTSSGSGTFTLDTIARASAITSAGNVTLGNACNVKWSPAASSFRYKLKFTLGNWSYTTGAIHPNTTAAYTYTSYAIPLDVANQLPKATTGTMTVTLYTYSNSGATTQVGSASSKTFTVTVPTSAAPVPTMSLSAVNNLHSAFAGLFVQGRSKIKASLSATFKYGATVSYYDFTVLGKTYGSSHSYTSDYIASTGTISVSGHAVDSRGYGGYCSGSVYVIPYSAPKILNVSVRRCTSDGTLMDSGTYLKISAKREYSKVVSNGSQKNFCQIRYRYKTTGSWSNWIELLSASNTSTDTVTSGALGGNFSAEANYYVEVQAVDTVGETASSVFIIPTEQIYQHEAGSMNSMGLGKYAQRANLLDVAWDINTDGTLTAKNIGDHVLIPTLYQVHSAAELTSYVSSVYSSIPDGGRRSVSFFINVDGLDLYGGRWHIDFMRNSVNYGCAIGYRYTSTGGALIALASLWDGTWSKWTLK